eukprot:Nitzschia sp. Nitz4//scaffold152_size53828//38559//38912//NITZ4_006749-RA/size53828-processed-gene-0.74-mRNA-1//1//CDS//3329537223//773//frame0
MVHGRAGLYLEAWKFSIYLFLPIGASVYFSDPSAQKFWADYWQFIKYPENPNTHVKEKIEELVKEKELQRDQRAAYQEQLKKLQIAAERSSATMDEDSSDSTESLSWWSKAGRWITG